jgi:hypothetical protein
MMPDEENPPVEVKTEAPVEPPKAIEPEADAPAETKSEEAEKAPPAA